MLGGRFVQVPPPTRTGVRAQANQRSVCPTAVAPRFAHLGVHSLLSKRQQLDEEHLVNGGVQKPRDLVLGRRGVSAQPSAHLAG